MSSAVLENQENPADHWRRSSTGEPLYNLLLKNLCESFTAESASGSEKVCRLHNEKLKLFCLDDKQSVCVVCRDSEKHVNHRFSPISGVKCIIQKYVLLLCRYRFLCCFFLLRLSLSSVSGKLQKHLINFMSFCNLKNKLQSLHLERRKSR